MDIVYAYEHPVHGMYGPSIFLAGPSPREESHPNWRPEALRILQEQGFGGVVYVPLPRDGVWSPEYEAQVHWEIAYLKQAHVIAFWVPRSELLPGYTTNVEYGEYLHSDKIVLGYPEGAPHMRYLHARALMAQVPIYHTLEETLAGAVAQTTLR